MLFWRSFGVHSSQIPTVSCWIALLEYRETPWFDFCQWYSLVFLLLVLLIICNSMLITFAYFVRLHSLIFVIASTGFAD
jgi:hypothetical protein